ncbi:MAG: MFS transporter [Pirellulales bacterium]|nr:MFS transporter [Pirellulales bacterium]
MSISVPIGTYIAVSAVMFLEYAVWGAWAPVLAARLLGPLKMSGKQTGWIYATLPLACIFAPFVTGWLADRWVNAEYILAVAHLIGAVLLFTAARIQNFSRLFVVMLFYSICYAGTLPLANTVLFRHAAADQGKVFIWAPIAWALAGYFLTGWRNLRKGEGDGSDCLKLAAVLSLAMVVASLFAPGTMPKAKEMPIVETLALLKGLDFLVFVVVSFVVAGMMQFYFLGSAQFMMDRGISGRNVPAAMAVAQAAQTVATVFVLWEAALMFFGLPKEQENVLALLGFKWTLTLGAACWLLMYVFYVAVHSRALIVVSQVLHGLAYVMFMIVGQVYVNAVAPVSIQSTAQALIFAATTGVGLFLGTQLAGIVMDQSKSEGKFQWSKIWAVPLAIVLVGTLVLAAIFQGSVPKNESSPPANSKAQIGLTVDRQPS